MPSSRDHPYLGIIPMSPASPALQMNSLPTEPPGSESISRFSHVQLFVTPGTAACQASLSFTNSWSLLKLMSIESVIAIQPSHPLS